MCLALPYRLTQIRGPGRALAEGPDGVRDVSTILLDHPAAGAYVLVAYGSAIREITPDEARELLELLEALQEPASEPQ
jgi:hydrogenase assembly chaperone HypC/HupF